MTYFINEVGANAGRSGHRRAVASSRVVYAAREAVAKLFNAPDSLRVVFGANVTESINLALRGILRPGDHVVTTSMEHNAVMRPLRALEAQGVDLTVVPCTSEGCLNPEDIHKAIRPETTLIVVNQASNVVGTVLPVAKIGKIARENDLLLLVDTAQTAGAYPIDMQEDEIDLLAFTGHKSLYGPMGTGGLVLGERVDAARISPLKCGGTGSRSEKEEQPTFLPDKFESGTQNVVGLAGLEASIQWILDQGVTAIRSHEVLLLEQLLGGLEAIGGVTLYGTHDPELQTATVSFTIEGMAPSEVGLRLDETYGIMSRVGLHCAPAAHKTIGTFPVGTVRFGLSAFNTEEEIQAGLAAVRALAEEARHE
jgi:cysteine desulfurase family protein